MIRVLFCSFAIVNIPAPRQGAISSSMPTNGHHCLRTLFALSLHRSSPSAAFPSLACCRLHCASSSFKPAISTTSRLGPMPSSRCKYAPCPHPVQCQRCGLCSHAGRVHSRYASQATESFAKLVPQGLRRQYFIRRAAKKKSGGMGVRFLWGNTTKKSVPTEVPPPPPTPLAERCPVGESTSAPSPRLLPGR